MSDGTLQDMQTLDALRYQISEPAHTHKDRQVGGICGNENLTEDYGVHGDDMLVYPYTEGGEFWTGPKFGCVHFESRRGEECA
jgi:hypothetical protein